MSHKEYQHVLKVWKWKWKTMKSYHDLHLKYHVLLLADVFQKFRNKWLTNYGLCPGRYLSAPALSWDAVLSINKVDQDQTLTCTCFLKKGMIAVVCYISKRCSKAKNKYLTSYDPTNLTKYIKYLDKNNYTITLRQNLFQWLDLSD